MKKIFVQAHYILLAIFGFSKAALKMTIIFLDLFVWRPVKKYFTSAFNKFGPTSQVSLTVNVFLALGWLFAAHCGGKAVIYFVASAVIAAVLVVYPVTNNYFQKRQRINK